MTWLFTAALYAAAVFPPDLGHCCPLRDERVTLQFAVFSPSDTVHRWTLLYGRKTVQAAALTTKHFRQGKSKKSWARQVHKALEKLDFLHLGGQVIDQRVIGETATVVFCSTLRTAEGPSKQIERYTLKRLGGQWFIDQIEVIEEIIPADVLERLIPGHGE